MKSEGAFLIWIERKWRLQLKMFKKFLYKHKQTPHSGTAGFIPAVSVWGVERSNADVFQ